MKTNLDELYKTNTNFEKDGIWLDISEKVGFLVSRFGGANSERVKLALAKYHKPYSRLIEKGTLPIEKETELTIKAFVEACLIDWKGVEIDGKETPFSKEVAIEFFKGLPDLLDELVSQASNSSNYKIELGNS